MKGYLVDYLGVGGEVFCRDDGRKELLAEHPAHSAPKPRAERKTHYNKIGFNFRLMDHCNDRAREGWILSHTAGYEVHPKYGSGETAVLWLFFTREGQN